MPNAVAQNRNTTLAAATIAGRRAGRVTVQQHLPRRRAEGRGGLGRPRVEGLPRGADRADHHGHVEEHQARDDCRRGLVEAEEAERPAVTEQLPERDADHHGRQHERHQQQRPHHAPSREVQPVQGVRRGQAEQPRRAPYRRRRTRA